MDTGTSGDTTLNPLNESCSPWDHQITLLNIVWHTCFLWHVL